MSLGELVFPELSTCSNDARSASNVFFGSLAGFGAVAGSFYTADDSNFLQRLSNVYSSTSNVGYATVAYNLDVGITSTSNVSWALDSVKNSSNVFFTSNHPNNVQSVASVDEVQDVYDAITSNAQLIDTKLATVTNDVSRSMMDDSNAISASNTFALALSNVVNFGFVRSNVMQYDVSATNLAVHRNHSYLQPAVARLQTCNDAYPYWGFSNVAGRAMYDAGGVTVGSSNSASAPLHIQGGKLVTIGDIVTFSDARLKRNIEPLQDALGTIEKLNAYTYIRRGESHRSIGLLAQEVCDAMPDALHRDPSGLLSIRYGGIVALLVESLRALDDVV